MVEALTLLTICAGRLEPTITDVTADLDNTQAKTIAVGSNPVSKDISFKVYTLANE